MFHHAKCGPRKELLLYGLTSLQGYDLPDPCSRTGLSLLGEDSVDTYPISEHAEVCSRADHTRCASGISNNAFLILANRN